MQKAATQGGKTRTQNIRQRTITTITRRTETKETGKGNSTNDKDFIYLVRRNPPLVSIKASIFSNVQNLTCIDLSQNKLQVLPDAICECKKLIVLNVSQNVLKVLPANLSLLVNLVKLDVSSNKLAKLPDVSGLRNLLYFDLTGNNLNQKNLQASHINDLETHGSLNRILIRRNPACKAIPRNRFYPEKAVIDNWKPFQRMAFLNAQLISDLPDQILPNLYLGSMAGATNPFTLRYYNITHIIRLLPTGRGKTVAEAYKHAVCPSEHKDSSFIAPQIKVLHIPVLDAAAAVKTMKKYLPKAIQFLEDATTNNNHVIVHCMAGISRSSTIVIAYVMFKLRLSWRKAYTFVNRIHHCRPNLAFQGVLEAYEKELNL